MALRWKTRLGCLALCALAAALFAPQADASALIKRFFGTQSEAKVADVWFGETLPNTLREVCKTTPLPMTKLWFKGLEDPVTLVEIQSVQANNKTLVVRRLLRTDENGDGKPEYRADTENHEAQIEHWRPRYLADCYDVSKNPADADAVAFTAWLYAQEDKVEKGLNVRLARRVLAVVYKRHEAARADIEEYIIEKEKLKGVKVGGFVLSNELDVYEEVTKDKDGKEQFTRYSVERETLLTSAIAADATKQLEKDAEQRLFEISDSLGDYGKPAAKRDKLPKKFLVLIQYDIKQYRERYKATKYGSSAATLKTLDDMDKSILDDFEALKTARANYDAAKTRDKKAEELERVLKLDPHDVRTARDCAMAWVAFANIEPDAGKSQNEKGLDHAIPIFERILKLRPGNTSYMYNLARCYQVKREAPAKPLYEEIIKLDGKDSDLGKKAAAMIALIR